jgi:hypothetical protein
LRDAGCGAPQSLLPSKDDRILADRTGAAGMNLRDYIHPIHWSAIDVVQLVSRDARR